MSSTTPESPGKPRHTNRLAQETSPYLLQHAHNPVDWHPWGSEALERARSENKPILLSIGYAACHWCHVMERESFENEAIARVMNEHFVCIKVDREERPDLDEIYMAATVTMSGSGGWPMTVFLTPDQKPFFAGTYFPPTDKYGRPGFRTLLDRINGLWTNERSGLEEQATELANHVREQSNLARPAPVRADAMADAVKLLAQGFDPRFGGFGGAPKFPPCPALSMLLRHHRRTGDAAALEMVKRTLDGMKNGGIYDHVGGGFARYSTDERWLVPHFEKMLYDNAQLSRVYLEAFQVTRDAEYERVARETLDYVVREMQGADGGYFSATDADSEGEEGKFFVWQPDEIVEILGAEAADAFSTYYDIQPGGNWEGQSIAHTPRPLDDVAKSLGLTREELTESISASKSKVYEHRKKRIPPLLDDKNLAAWNGLMIGAMAEGYRVLRDARYLESATRAARFVLDKLARPDGGLFRTARAGKSHLDAYLEDYAYFTDALIDVYEAGGPADFLREATRLAERMLMDFGDADAGAFYFTAHTHEALIARPREGHDGAIPNPNAVASRALARLAVHLGRDDLRARAEAAVRAYGRFVERQPRAFATTLSLVDFLSEPPIELVLVGSPDDREPLAREVARHYLPNRVVAVVDPGATATPRPLTEGKTLVDGKAALYVCRNYTCQAPIVDPAKVAIELERASAKATDARASAVGTTRLGGAATAEGTNAYADKKGHGFIPLSTTGLRVSRLGFGGYRVHERDPDHRNALSKALREGVNLIDTSTNYTDGSSERLIGEVLADLVKQGAISRDQMVVVSKIGYVQAKNLEIAEAREREGRAFPEMVKVGPGIWHSMHPEWLADQLDRSLDRLGLEALDVCLIHNPEYFFTDAVKRGEGPLEKLRDEFYRRLEAAFAHFENEVKRGRIRWYGVSSNSAIESANDREATALSRMLECAERAGGNGHHFRVLQLPFNLLEPGAILEKNNHGKSVLELAREREIAVLVNRPLNAIIGDGLIRLADPPKLAGTEPFEATRARVEELESEFRSVFAPTIRTGPGMPPPEALLNWAEQLGRLPPQADQFAQWAEVESQVIIPRVNQVMTALDRALAEQAQGAWQSFRDRYVEALEVLLAAVRQRASERARATSAAIHAAIDPHLPAEARTRSLSQKALHALVVTPGVTTVLLGMRDPAYVDDALPVLGFETFAGVERIFRALADASIPGR